MHSIKTTITKRFRILSAFGGCALFAATASATPITGVANIAGSVSVSGTSIQFAPVFGVPFGSTETGSFAGLTGGTVNSTLTGPPLVGAISVPNFITFTSGLAAPVFFDLTAIQPGTGTPGGCNNTVGSVCTLAGSPFTLTQKSTPAGLAVTVDLALSGLGYTAPASGGTSPTLGIYTTQFVSPGTITGILSQLAGGGFVSGASYSATYIASPVPEPGSIFLMGFGLVGAGLVARRKLRS